MTLSDLFRKGCDNNSGASNSRRNSSSGFYSELTARLRMLNFQAFRTLVFLWLSAEGYRQVKVLKRSSSRGRRPVGGPDFLAISPYLPRTRVAIQIRHWQTPVQKRVVDEMRGWMLRLGISQGLIVTRSVFYRGAIRAAKEVDQKSVSLVSGPRLAGSMASLGLGVEKIGGRHGVADWFFRGLGQIQLGYSLSGGKILAKDVNRKLEESIAGPGFGDQWPGGIVWLVLIMLLVLVLTAVFGGPR